MFGKEFSKREMLLIGVLGGMVVERGINKLIAWRTEVARTRLYAANPELAQFAKDNIQSNIRAQAKSFHANPRK
jgi:hypothetical protein